MKISVVVPCFNGEAFLAQALDSALNQTLPPWEVIVVDDGSTDGSLALAAGYGGVVKAISQRNAGASAARNAGVAVAGGDAIMFLDADDLLGPTALRELAAVLSRHPDVVACCPWYRLEEVGGCWLTKPASCAPRRRGQDALSAWLTGWYHPPCSVLWSRRAYERSGGWDPAVGVNDDGDVVMRGLASGNALVPTREGTAYYRRLPGGSPSLSGTRSTRAGVESRMLVLGKIAAMLEQGGRLARYRAPLGEAYEAVAADCRDLHPDLQQQCRSATRRLAGPPWLRGARGALGRFGAPRDRVGRRPDRAVGPPSATGAGEGVVREDGRRRPLAGAGARGEGGSGAEQPFVSVIIPTHNRAHLLPRALNSVLEQSYGHFELLVVDDGSTDGTAEVVAGYDEPRIRYLRQPRNRGVAAARNRGLHEARGELVAFLDDDDEWMPGKLARQVAVFAKGSGRLGLVYTGVETVRGEGAREIDLPAHRGDIHAKMLLRNVVHGGPSNAVIRRRIVATVGYFDEALPAIEDYDYWLRVARFYEVDFVGEPLSRYYDQAVEDGERAARRRSRDFAANLEARRLFFDRYRHEMRRAGVEHLFLLDSARRHLESPFGDAAAAARLVARGLSRRPTARRLYPWLLLALLPDPARRAVRRAARNLRSRVEPDPARTTAERPPLDQVTSRGG